MLGSRPSNDSCIARQSDDGMRDASGTCTPAARQDIRPRSRPPSPPLVSRRASEAAWRMPPWAPARVVGQPPLPAHLRIGPDARGKHGQHVLRPPVPLLHLVLQQQRRNVTCRVSMWTGSCAGKRFASHASCLSACNAAFSRRAPDPCHAVEDMDSKVHVPMPSLRDCGIVGLCWQPATHCLLAGCQRLRSEHGTSMHAGPRPCCDMHVVYGRRPGEECASALIQVSSRLPRSASQNDACIRAAEKASAP